METDVDNLVKDREICFATLHPSADQARAAALTLGEIEGIQQLQTFGPALLRVRYHLLSTTYSELLGRLEEEGFHIANDLLYRLKRALYCYTEETQRANLGCHAGERNCTRKVFVNRYKRQEHGCRDSRPEHWRQYR